jgi:hypothetical protein
VDGWTLAGASDAGGGASRSHAALHKPVNRNGAIARTKRFLIGTATASFSIPMWSVTGRIMRSAAREVNVKTLNPLELRRLNATRAHMAVLLHNVGDA